MLKKFMPLPTLGFGGEHPLIEIVSPGMEGMNCSILRTTVVQCAEKCASSPM